jgi:SAM-dependent methyltransferase
MLSAAPGGRPTSIARVPSDRAWLSSIWPTIRGFLPPSPALVAELGCGTHGGLVPSLNDAGYTALGIDPAAPAGPGYQRAEFERADLPRELDAVVACTSLHHVADPALVLDTVAEHLPPDGIVVVVEWDWERFDEATARWCFERLGPSSSDHGWLDHRRAGWLDSGARWEDYLRGWASEHGLHSATTILRELDRRFERTHCSRGPYLFADLADASEQDELRAISTGQIKAMRIDYVGRLARR